MWEWSVVLTSSGWTWTPETFYAVAAVVQLLLILGAFRLLGLSPEHNTFVGAAIVVIPANGVAFFMKYMGLVGVLIPAVVFFGLLTFVTRGDVLKAGAAWFGSMAVYWGMATLILPTADDLYIDDLGGLPQVLLEGGLEVEPMTEDDLEALSGRGGGGD